MGRISRGKQLAVPAVQLQGGREARGRVEGRGLCEVQPGEWGEEKMTGRSASPRHVYIWWDSLHHFWDSEACLGCPGNTETGDKIPGATDET